MLVMSLHKYINSMLINAFKDCYISSTDSTHQWHQDAIHFKVITHTNLMCAWYPCNLENYMCTWLWEQKQIQMWLVITWQICITINKFWLDKNWLELSNNWLLFCTLVIIYCIHAPLLFTIVIITFWSHDACMACGNCWLCGSVCNK